MAMKLTKAEREEQEQLTERLNEAAASLQDAVRELNEKLEVLRNDVIPVEQEYNSVLEDVRAFAERIAERIESEIDEKSEKWQEGEKGEQAATWRDEWQAADFAEVDLDYPQDMEELALEDAERLEQLPQEAE